MANPAIVVDFLADTAGLRRGVEEAKGSTKGFGSTLKNLGKAGAVAAGVAGVGALTETLKIGIDRWTESTKLAAQTNAVIKSTGDVSHVTAGHVDDLATSLMKKSGVDKETITTGENLLLTFTNVRNEVGKGNDIFDQATTAANDMSVALGTNVSQSAKQLGKALQDPEKGTTRLTRSGVLFTDQQKAMIKTLQDSGNTLGAQKIILQQVNTVFGGSAEALGKTLPGEINIAKQSFNDFAEELVAKFIPIIQDVIGWLRDHWPEISRELNQMWVSVKPILANLGDLLLSVVKVVKDNWTTIGPYVNAVAQVIKDAAVIIVAALKLITDLLRGNWSAAWTDMQKIVSTEIDAIKTILRTELDTFGKIATALGSAILNGLGAGITGIDTAVEEKLNAIRQSVSDAAAGAYAAAKNFGARILAGIGDGLVGAVTAVESRIDAAQDAVVAAAGAAYAAAKNFGAQIVAGVVDGLGNIVKQVEGIANSVADAIKKPINTVIAGWNSIVFTVPTIDIPSVTVAGHKIGGGSIGGESIGFPKIPYLAAGGIVTAPTLAMVGEAGPEAVIPLSSSGAPVEVRVFIGDTELKGLVRTEVRTQNNRVAQTLLAGMS